MGHFDGMRERIDQTDLAPDLVPVARRILTSSAAPNGPTHITVSPVFVISSGTLNRTYPDSTRAGTRSTSARTGAPERPAHPAALSLSACSDGTSAEGSLGGMTAWVLPRTRKGLYQLNA